MNFPRLLLASLVVVGLAAGIADGQVKKRIAVARFDDGAGYHGCGTGVADMLATALVKSGKFLVVERKDLDKMIKEQQLGLSGVVTEQTAAKVGRVLGVDLMVVGSVSELGTKKRDIGGGISIFDAGVSSKTARAAVDIRLVNTTTGEIVAAETEEGTESTLGVGVRYDDINFSDMSAWDDTDLGKAAREAVNNCVELITDNMDAIPWSGRIIKVNNDGTVLMKPGSEGNVTKDMEFNVFQLGEEIIDPDTGLPLGNEETKVGSLKVVSDMLGGKACKAKIVDGKGMKTGDVVRLPE